MKLPLNIQFFYIPLGLEIYFSFVNSKYVNFQTVAKNKFRIPYLALTELICGACGKESAPKAGDISDVGLIPGLGRTP